MKEWARERGILLSEDIDYSIRTRNFYGGGSMGRYTLSANPDCMYEYKIYVYKRNFIAF